MNACDGENAQSYTIWCYEPKNTFKWGDGWNGENLSIFSTEDISNKANSKAPTTLEGLLLDGGRAVQSACRPYPATVFGELRNTSFNVSKAKYKLEVYLGTKAKAGIDPRDISMEQAKDVGDREPTVIYLGYIHFRKTTDEVSKSFMNRVNPEATHIIGERDPQNEMPWSDQTGEVPVLDLCVQVSHGRVEIKGQYAYWYYDQAIEGEVLSLTIKRWGGSLWTAFEAKH